MSPQGCGRAMGLLVREEPGFMPWSPLQGPIHQWGRWITVVLELKQENLGRHPCPAQGD